MVLADELDEQLLGTVWKYNLVKKKRYEIQTNSLMMPFILYAVEGWGGLTFNFNLRQFEKQ